MSTRTCPATSRSRRPIAISFEKLRLSKFSVMTDTGEESTLVLFPLWASYGSVGW